jgi:hypothetical protein
VESACVPWKVSVLAWVVCALYVHCVESECICVGECVFAYAWAAWCVCVCATCTCVRRASHLDAVPRGVRVIRVITVIKVLRVIKISDGPRVAPRPAA